MTPAAVGIRCPDHSGKPQGIERVRRTAVRAGFESTGAYVTKALIALNVGVFLAELATGGSINGVGSRIYEKGVLISRAVDSTGQVVGVAEGDWWRLISAAFLHYGIFHLAINMYSLWYVGQALEHALGRGRFLLLYLVSGLAGSAGALLISPDRPTVGASGAIFGILGAALVLERRGHLIFGGQAMTLIVINLVITFAFRNSISVGGHVGGLIGGALCMVALDRFRREVALQVASLVAIGVVSVVIAYMKVNGRL
jgi:membrane associated rhomboid family serine protease